jgi:hypothetical protein
MYERSFGIFRDPSLRASDADREATAERLRHNHSEGRLDTEEFQQRIDRCYSAKTVGELDELVNDLPRESRERVGRRGRRSYWRLWPIPVVPVVLAIIAISAVAGWHHHGGFGLLWLIPLFFFVRMCAWRRYRRWETF